LERTNKTIGLRSDTNPSIDKKVCGPWFQSSRAGVVEIDLENKLDPYKSYNNIDLEPVKAFPKRGSSSVRFDPLSNSIIVDEDNNTPTTEIDNLIIPNLRVSNTNLNFSNIDFIENQHLTSETLYKNYTEKLAIEKEYTDEKLKKQKAMEERIVELTPPPPPPKIIPCSLQKIMDPSIRHVVIPSSQRTAGLRSKPKVINKYVYKSPLQKLTQALG
jgi:hypothetical protein